MTHRRNPLLVLATAALLSSGAAFAQSDTLTAPNNSAGTPLDVPRLHMPGDMRSSGPDTPMPTENAQSAFQKLDRNGNGYVTREDLESLPQSTQIPFDRADLNHDGRLDANEFQGAWNDYDGGSN
ncbi:MAG: EF-hand domain-containing protein [Burkholderiales bacterium]